MIDKKRSFLMAVLTFTLLLSGGCDMETSLTGKTVDKAMEYMEDRYVADEACT